MKTRAPLSPDVKVGKWSARGAGFYDLIDHWSARGRASYNTVPISSSRRTSVGRGSGALWEGRPRPDRCQDQRLAGATAGFCDLIDHWPARGRASATWSTIGRPGGGPPTTPCGYCPPGGLPLGVGGEHCGSGALWEGRLVGGAPCGRGALWEGRLAGGAPCGRGALAPIRAGSRIGKSYNAVHSNWRSVT